MAEKQKGGWMKTFLVVVVAVAAVVVVVMIATRGSDGSTTTKTTTAPTTKTIPGIAAVDLHGNLTDRGFTLRKNLTLKPASWICTLRTDEYQYEGGAYGAGPSQITKIDAMTLNFSSKDTGTVAVDFLALIASMPYEGANQSQAQAWVRANINTAATTVIGPVKFEMTVNPDAPRARILTLTPN